MRPELVDDSVAAMNLVAENTRNGVQVTWQVYSPEEIAANSSLGCVQLYYFPGKEPGGKYALVVPGNGSTMTSEMEEGGSAATSCMNRATPCSCCGTAPGSTWATMRPFRILPMR